MEDVTVIILTYNEILHIRRAIDSVKSFVREIIVVDSFSTDATCEMAREAGARVIQRAFVHQADQMQWAMDNAGIRTTWVMRLDADEYLLPELATEIQARLRGLQDDIHGVILKRRMYFMGQWIRHGGFYPIRLLRIWRNGHARMEQRLMDEHIYLTEGRAVEFNHDIVDENLNQLTWWTNKHNQYATREAAQWLGQRHDVLPQEEKVRFGARQVESKRWYKRNLYDRLPLLLRPFLYFHFRYFFQLGLMDGRPGLVWHFLQGFWYRFLVDAKILQVLWMARKEGVPIEHVLREQFGVPVLEKEERESGG